MVLTPERLRPDTFPIIPNFGWEGEFSKQFSVPPSVDLTKDPTVTQVNGWYMIELSKKALATGKRVRIE